MERQTDVVKDRKTLQSMIIPLWTTTTITTRMSKCSLTWLPTYLNLNEELHVGGTLHGSIIRIRCVLWPAHSLFIGVTFQNCHQIAQYSLETIPLKYIQLWPYIYIIFSNLIIVIKGCNNEWSDTLAYILLSNYIWQNFWRECSIRGQFGG